MCITAFKDKEFWTDGSNAVNNDVYMFRDGSSVPMDLNNFWSADDSPSFGSTYCLRLEYFDDYWRWNDKGCGYKTYFICEYN